MQKFDKNLTKNAILNPKPYEISNLTFYSKTTKLSKHKKLQKTKKSSKIQKNRQKINKFVKKSTKINKIRFPDKPFSYIVIPIEKIS